MDFQSFFVFCLLFSSTLSAATNSQKNGDYEVGVGIGDVTGLAAGIGLMGYANLLQIGKGIHTRLFARTFIVKENESRVAFVSVDIGMIDTAIKNRVVNLLQDEFGELYTAKNLLLSATHTHSGPGGYIQYAMYGIVSLGFHRPNFESIVDGIVQSIRKAHHSLQPGHLSVTTGDLLGANINRSPYSYNQNPPDEIAVYPYNVEKGMTLLRIDAADGTELGMFNWFAVHATSMNNTNKLVSGDNKGYASMAFEYKKNPNHRPGKGPFVAAFASSNGGDASPNIDGPKCRGGPHEGDSCDLVTSTCGEAPDEDFVTHCYALGPGDNGDMEHSTEIIGERQYLHAWELHHRNASEFVQISGRLQHAQQQINMNKFKFEYVDENGANADGTTCSSALGYSFAAGTEDGPGMFNFTQGELSGSEFWDAIRDFLKEPTPEQITCHAPKPILLAVGEIEFPYPWVPSIVETQILRIGNLYLIGVPGEFTTMAGRRLRQRVKNQIIAHADPTEPEPIVVIAGYSNLYTHYITTYEEYQVQRYEGASTIYGPRTLDAYIHQYGFLTDKMLQNETIEELPPPEDITYLQISLLPPVVIDLPPAGSFMGQAKEEPSETYLAGETVRAVFVAGHLRNNGLREGSYFTIERLRDDGSGWDVVATDADWSTKLLWRRPQRLFGLDSQIEISWETSTDTQVGVYRVRHFGYYKPYQLEPLPYQGTSRTFEVKSRSVMGGLFRVKQDRKESSFVKFWKKLTNSHLF